ncbi:MAG: GNAT family N-acetyltransferase [Acidimicrobiales bacterium]
MAPRAVTTRSGEVVEIDDITDDERPALFTLFAGIVERNEGFPQAHPLSPEEFDAAWGRGASAVVVARHDTALAGAYYLRPNSPGRAAHIVNAGFVIAPAHRRRGVGRALVEDSVTRAAALGFDAMQFNLVFESNPARRLYEDLGFAVVGRIPRAVEGEDALVYWRALD